MIKFFRKIRFHLIKQNKTGRYFTYAIGEIILVVIGILIALQINNWNENQKVKKREAETLTQLNDESVQIINVIQSDISLMEDFIEASKLTIKDLQTSMITANDTAHFAKGIIAVTFYPGLSVPRNVYDEIKSAGFLREIQASEVRKAIANYYADLDWIESQLNYFRDVTLTSGTIYREGFYSEFDESKTLMRRYDIDFDKLKNDKEFRSVLSRGLRNLIVFQNNRRRLLNSALEMKNALDKSLGL